MVVVIGVTNRIYPYAAHRLGWFGGDGSLVEACDVRSAGGEHSPVMIDQPLLTLATQKGRGFEPFSRQ
jgi:hypothetical protein